VSFFELAQSPAPERQKSKLGSVTMKTAVTAILVLVGAAAVAADDFPSNMPDCGKTCGRNMLGQSAQLGCAANDIPCLCRNANFGYGIHDCSVQACGNTEQANIVIGWGNNLCANAGVPANIASATAAGAGTAAPAPVATSMWTSVLTSGSVTTTLTGETTISGTSGVASETMLTSPIVSTLTSGSLTLETTVGATRASPPPEATSLAHTTTTGSAQVMFSQETATDWDDLLTGAAGSPNDGSSSARRSRGRRHCCRPPVMLTCSL